MWVSAFHPLQTLGSRRYGSAMADDAPWFRRWFGFALKPIKWQGWAATGAFLLIESPLGLLSLGVEAGSLAWWLLAASGFAIFLGFWAFVLSKTESR